MANQTERNTRLSCQLLPSCSQDCQTTKECLYFASRSILFNMQINLPTVMRNCRHHSAGVINFEMKTKINVTEALYTLKKIHPK